MKHYGLVGHPLTHSFSRKYFTEKFENEHLDCDFALFDYSDLKQFIASIPQNDLSGFTVTIPYKKAIIPFLDELDPTAAKIGAVNAVRVNSNYGKPKLKGFNTDIIGFEHTLVKMMKQSNFNHRTALILGSGGASEAVQYVLNKLNISFNIVSRNASDNHLIYNDLTKEIVHNATIIINTTPLGMFPKTNACPEIPYQYLTNKHILIDLVYNPTETLFMQRGNEQGAVTCNGLEMLYTQADAAWSIWNEE